MQRLKAVTADKDSQSVAACLPPWAYVYNKLVMDNNRSADVSHCMQLSFCMHMGMHICMCLDPIMRQPKDTTADKASQTKMR